MLSVDRFVIKRKAKNKDWYIWDREKEHMVLTTGNYELACNLLEPVNEYYVELLAQQEQEKNEVGSD